MYSLLEDALQYVPMAKLKDAKGASFVTFYEKMSLLRPPFMPSRSRLGTPGTLRRRVLKDRLDIRYIIYLDISSDSEIVLYIGLVYTRVFSRHQGTVCILRGWNDRFCLRSRSQLVHSASSVLNKREHVV